MVKYYLKLFAIARNRPKTRGSGEEIRRKYFQNKLFPGVCKWRASTELWSQSETKLQSLWHWFL